METVVVDSIPELYSLINDISSLPPNPPPLYINLEGIELGRQGSVSIMSLCVPAKKKIYHIDIHVLGSAAFTTTTSSGKSLKTVLESSTIPKVFFDMRKDSDALFAHYQVSLARVQDVQLMELATRKYSKKWLASLVKCTEDSTIPTAVRSSWQNHQTSLRNVSFLYRRPIPAEVERYCSFRVSVLPDLWKFYDTKLRPANETFWREKVDQTTKERIRLSHSMGASIEATTTAQGPWDPDEIEEEIDAWNEEVMENAREEAEEEAQRLEEAFEAFKDEMELREEEISDWESDGVHCEADAW